MSGFETYIAVLAIMTGWTAALAVILTIMWWVASRIPFCHQVKEAVWGEPE